MPVPSPLRRAAAAVTAVAALVLGATGVARADDPQPPDAPVQLMMTQDTDGWTFSWTAPGEHGSPVTGYEVDRSTDDGETWTAATTTTATSVPIADPAAGSLVDYRVLAESDAGPSVPSDTASVDTPGYGTQRIVVQAQGGQAITGGRIRWSDGYGTWSTYQSLSADGVVDFAHVAPGYGMLVQLSEGVSPGDVLVSKEWSVDFGTAPQTLVVPPPPAMEVRHVSVVMPTGVPVPGVEVDADYDQGLALFHQSDDGFFYLFDDGHGDVIDDGTTGADGTVTLRGWSTEGVDYIPPPKYPYPQQAVHVYYNDGVQHQEGDFLLDGDDTIITLDPMPWLSTAQPAVTAAGRTAAVDFTVHHAPAAAGSVTPDAVAASSLAGVKVRLVPPAGWTASRCAARSSLVGTSDAHGDVRLKVCGAVSGAFRVRSTGAVRTGAVVMRVRHAAAAAPAKVTAASTAKGALTVGWSAPGYAGGVPVTGYVVALTAPGQKTRSVSVSAGTHRRTFSGLTRAIAWTASVRAVTRYHAGAAASASARVL